MKGVRTWRDGGYFNVTPQAAGASAGLQECFLFYKVKREVVLKQSLHSQMQGYFTSKAKLV